jgi:hypothetical protein
MELAPYYPSRRRRRWLMGIASMVVAGLTAFAVYDGVAASPKAAAVAEADRPAVVEPIGKTGRNRVMLIPEAVKRLGITTAAVSSAVVRGEQRRVMPYAAVLYDTNGATWTYTSPKRFVYVRHDIRIDGIEGELAVLAAGPNVGVHVVTVGAQELWGIEYGGIEEG